MCLFGGVDMMRLLRGAFFVARGEALFPVG